VWELLSESPKRKEIQRTGHLGIRGVRTAEVKGLFMDHVNKRHIQNIRTVNAPAGAHAGKPVVAPRPAG